MLLMEDKLTIRNATREDAKLLCDWWNDGRVMAHAGFPNGLGVTEQVVMDQIASDTDKTYRRLILEIDKVSVGEMSYRNMGHNAAEIGIKICVFDKQGKGFGSRFLMMLIHELFQMGYVKIVLDTNMNNERAQHVYEKLGFRKVGVRMNSWVDQLGIMQSTVDYELLKLEFNMYQKHIDYKFINSLSKQQIDNLLDIYKGESWSKNREIDDVKRMLEKSWVIALVASGSGNMIAFARVLTDFIFRAFIYDVIVAKEYRGLGFGKLMVDNIVNHEDIKHVERIELYCNDKNVSFYQKLGFDKVPDEINMMRYNINKSE